MKIKCSYTRTYIGHCDQLASGDGEYCYYHNKVAEGLIETSDPILSLKNKNP